ncbi:MAG: DNA replication regulator sld2 [Peltula sp. TS41687]|nr:MAG: DNA replication regulator sld2 [Peltula sp. TS41687]
MASSSIQAAENALERSEVLRAELKAWERRFSASNGGRKAGREDIKRDTEIASKYKEYTNVREKLSAGPKSTQQPPREPSPLTQKKRKAVPDEQQLPRQAAHQQTPKRHKPDLTPTQARYTHHPHPAVVDPYDSPSVIRQLPFTPCSRRMVVGPTPQRDGKVLGLFDPVEEDEEGGGGGGGLGKMPSKARVLKEVSLNTNNNNKTQQHHHHCTPRKPPIDSSSIVTPLRYGRTPVSSGKRYLLDKFVTPSKRKRAGGEYGDDDDDYDGDDGLKTPAFLRRGHHRPAKAPKYDENGELQFDSPVTAVRRWPLAKAPLRGLSSIIAGLRKMEEEKLDEEMDVLREMEDEASNRKEGRKSGAEDEKTRSLPTNDRKASEIGSQNLVALQGVGEEGKEGEQGKGEQSNKPSKPWRKRGQKRTTKRVIIRPSRAKPTLQPSNLNNNNNNNSSALDHTEPLPVVPDFNPDTTAATAPTPGNQPTSAATKAGDEEEEEEEEEGGGGGGGASSSTKTKPSKNPIKKVVRKISSTAHANFRRLKIKSKGGASKGGGGGGGGFGGRRRFGRR